MLAEMALRREKVMERLLDLRERHGLSQEHAAQRVGITHRQWQRWETGASMPYPRNLDAVATAFGISVADFFDAEPAIEVSDVGQLDRMEAKLDEILNLLAPGLAEVLEEEGDRIDAQQGQNDGERQRKPARRTAS